MLLLVRVWFFLVVAASLLEYFWLYSKNSYPHKQGLFNINTKTEMALKYVPKSTFIILYLERDLCICKGFRSNGKTCQYLNTLFIRIILFIFPINSLS